MGCRMPTMSLEGSANSSEWANNGLIHEKDDDKYKYSRAKSSC